MSFKMLSLGACFVAILQVYGAQAETVFIESNRGDSNSLLAFSMIANGSLSEKPSVPTGGLGVVDPSLALGPFDSDQEIIVNPQKTLLFAVNSGSNSVAVFRIGSNATLTPVPGSPFPSHGVNPVSLGLRGSVLTVVNKHQDPLQAMDESLPNYTTFEVQGDGSLHWTQSVLEVANGSSPSQALITPFAPLVIGADFLGGILRSLVVDWKGQLTDGREMGLPDSEFVNSMAPHLPLGLAAHPRRNLVYVGFPTANKIGVYKYDRAGNLDFLGATMDSGQVVCWLKTNSAGTRLYASNTADPSVTVYDISADPEKPKEIQKIVLPSKGGAYQLALNSDGTHLVVLTQRFQMTTPQGQGNEIHVLDVGTDGKLQEKITPTVLALPPNVRPQGVAIVP